MDNFSCINDDLIQSELLNTGKVWIETICVTIIVLLIHMKMHSVYQRCLLNCTFVNVTVIGMGPIGLISALIAKKSQMVNTIRMYEKHTKTDILNRQYQVALNNNNVEFLRSLGVDFDNLEGCWEHGCFFTRVGVLSEYIISLLSFSDRVVMKFNCKVSIL